MNLPKVASTKSVKSSKSVRSASTRSVMEDETSSEVAPLNFETYLPLVCKTFNLPYTVVVKKEYQCDQYYRHLKYEVPVKYKKINVIAPKAKSELFLEKIDTIDTTTIVENNAKDAKDNNTITVTSIYNNMNHLSELKIHKVKDLPRELIQILCFLTQCYADLTKVRIMQCRINGYTIYEFNKLLPLTSITEIFLDGSKVSEGNYDILLDHPQSRIMHLSLSRCQINDDVCKRIVSKITFSAPAETSLKVLNLSSNLITDVGAKYLGKTLRMNRNLRYLNVADNRITDDGAGYLLNSLTEFLLTFEETVNKRRRYMEYEKKRLAMYLKCLTDFQSLSVDNLSNTKDSAKRKSAGSNKRKLDNNAKDMKNNKHFHLEDYKTRAEMLVGELISPFRDPFQKNFILIKDGMWYCKGNMVLCYLNLSYNSLSYLSVVKLLKVLKYQSTTKQFGQQGLMRVLFEGNYLPETCPEYTDIEQLLGKNMAMFGGKMYTDYGIRKKSRVSRVSLSATTEKSPRSK